MKETDNMKEIANKNVDMESNKQIRENAKKDVRTKEKVICNVSENCKNAPLEKILENDKTNFKCNFEKHLKFKEKNMHKIIVGKININSVRNKFGPLMAFVGENIEILPITETKKTPHFPQTNFILMAITYPKDITVTQTVVAFWFMSAIT